MTYYNIEDLVIGETMDPRYPAYIALGDNAIKVSRAEFAAFDNRVSNQNRRLGRQQQIREANNNERL
jgi:hypothetical protein